MDNSSYEACVKENPETLKKFFVKNIPFGFTDDEGDEIIPKEAAYRGHPLYCLS